MTDNNKNKDIIKKIKRQRIVQNVDGKNYAKVGGTKFLASGEVAYVEAGNAQALKLEHSKENPHKNLASGKSKDFGADVAVKGYSAEMDNLFAAPQRASIRPQAKQRA
ncbi:MAG: hypothetical protein ACK5N8_00455 [Alphaproteobacteria bacterium]